MSQKLNSHWNAHSPFPAPVLSRSCQDFGWCHNYTVNGPSTATVAKTHSYEEKRVGPLKNIITVPKHTEHLTVLVLLYIVKRSIWLRLGNIKVWSWLGQRNTWLGRQQNSMVCPEITTYNPSQTYLTLCRVRDFHIHHVGKWKELTVDFWFHNYETSILQ